MAEKTKKKRRVKLTRQTIDKIIKLHNEFLTPSEIQKILGNGISEAEIAAVVHPEW